MRRSALGLFASILALFGCESEPEATPSPTPAGLSDRGAVPHSETHAQLLRMARRIRASNNMYFGESELRELEQADTTGLEPKSLADLDYRMAEHHFRLGNVNEAENLYRRCYERTPTAAASYRLGITQLRIGELENCLARHSPESCVFPIRGGGVHTERSGAERAYRTFLRTLEEAPQHLRPQVRWFISLSAMALGEYPGDLPGRATLPAESLGSDYDVGRFPDRAMGLGVAARNLAGGVVVEDLDGDGLLDVATSTTELEGQLLYYRNAGDGTFEDRTEEAGLLGQIGGLNMVHADYDGDGDRDLFLLRGGWLGTFGRMPNALLRNRGNGTFEDVTRRAGLDEPYPCQTAAFADYDLDGDLDLFLGNETPPPASGQQYPCEMYRNEGDGTFTEVTVEAGLEVFKLVKGAAWGDWNGDRYPDLFLSNQFGPNSFFRNEGDGTFTDVAEEVGLQEPTNSFSTWWWDYDHDGSLDLFVAGYGGHLIEFARSWIRPGRAADLNALLHNEGGVFRDRAEAAGLDLQALTMGANYGDLDNDGWLDFYLGTGAPDVDALIPNLMYRNDGNGGFQNVTESGGFGNIQKGHAIAFGDLDNDGDQDVYAQFGGMYPYDEYFNSLFVNPGHGNRWITLELVGVRSNRDGLGSRIRLRIRSEGETRDIVRWVWPRGSFGSGTFRQEIGLGKAERIEFVEVYWPASDTTQKLEGLEPDRFYRITEFESEAEELSRPTVTLAAGTDHQHHHH